MYTFIFICQRKGMHTLSNLTCYLVSWNLQDCSRYWRFSVKSQTRNTLRIRMFQAHVSMILSKALERKKKLQLDFHDAQIRDLESIRDRGVNESNCVQCSAWRRHSSLSLDIYDRSVPQLYVTLPHWTLCLSVYIIWEHTALCWGAKLKPGPTFLALPSMLTSNIPAMTVGSGWDWIEDLGLDPRSAYQLGKLRHLGYLSISMSLNVK